MGYRENYQAWLRDFAADEQAVAELKAIEGDEKEIKDYRLKDVKIIKRNSAKQEEKVDLEELKQLED